MTIPTALFVVLIIFAIIGGIFSLIILLYIIVGVIDLTYQNRHKDERANNCPEFVDKEDDQE